MGKRLEDKFWQTFSAISFEVDSNFCLPILPDTRFSNCFRFNSEPINEIKPRFRSSLENFRLFEVQSLKIELKFKVLNFFETAAFGANQSANSLLSRFVVFATNQRVEWMATHCLAKPWSLDYKLCWSSEAAI